jgi:hypothetical protein
MRHCPKCRSEYQDWVKACLDCASPLVDGPPSTGDETASAEEVGDGDERTDQQGEEQSESEDKVEDHVDEVIESEDFLAPESTDEYAEPSIEVPRAELTSVFSGRTAEGVKRVGDVLYEAGIKTYLLKKSGLLDYFYVIMVEAAESEKAAQILKETDNGTLEPLEPGVEDPELKDAPIINLDEEEEKAKKSQPVPDEEDAPVICAMCDSSDIEVKTSFFSSKTKLKCRGCGHQWGVE